jgi:hypothetical protein
MAVAAYRNAVAKASVASGPFQRVQFRLIQAKKLYTTHLLLLCHRLLRNAIFPKKINRLATCVQKY